MKLLKELESSRDKGGYLRRYAEFLCPKCNEIVVRNLHAGLKQNYCGCNRNYKHGGTHTKLYEVYLKMKQRVLNPNNKAYKNYGGRGITICPEWTNDYTKFRDWALNNGYQEGLTIDRINNNDNYEPNNCQWITKTENNKNTRRIKLTLQLANEIRRLYNTGYYKQIDLAKIYNVPESTISNIINHKIWKEQ